jgi:bacterioferritin
VDGLRDFGVVDGNSTRPARLNPFFDTAALIGAIRRPLARGRDQPDATHRESPGPFFLFERTIPNSHAVMNNPPAISREEIIRLLNEDLAREYQAIIAYVVYSQTMKGAKYQHIAKELQRHAGEELAHAIIIAKQIDYFNGTPVTTPKPVKLSDDPDDMLRFDLENERVTIIAYRERILQAEALGEFALSEALREIIVQEQEHLTDLADALGIDNPKLG